MKVGSSDVFAKNLKIPYFAKNTPNYGKACHKALTHANAYEYVKKTNDVFFLISLKNDQLYHKRPQNWKIGQTDLTNKGLIISAS